MEVQLDAEIDLFRKYITNPQVIQQTSSTKRFWMSHKDELKLLFQVAAILMNTFTSASFLERFFSICGVILTVRNAQMKNDLIIMRCMFKANMHLLKDLSMKK